MPTPSTYVEQGYRNRRHYLEALADDNGVPLDHVLILADTLGPNEDFDGLVTAVEDMAGMSSYQ